MGYREHPPPPQLRQLVECIWTAEGERSAARVLPDGCMDLVQMDGSLLVAGPDTTAFLTERGPEPSIGVRFRPGVLPRLIAVPAVELRDSRVAFGNLIGNSPRLHDNQSVVAIAAALARRDPSAETAPWSMRQLAYVTRQLGSGSAVADVARDIGWSARTLQRQCMAVYGYGPATLRRILRFRRAMQFLNEGLPSVEAAVRAGYADQPHLHREVRALAGVPLTALRHDSSGANKSTQLPSGSATVA